MADSEVNGLGRYGDLPPQVLVSNAGLEEANGIYTLLPLDISDGAVLYLQGGGFTIDRRHLSDGPHEHGLVLSRGDQILYTNHTNNRLDPSAVSRNWIPSTPDLAPQPIIKKANLSLATWGKVYCKAKNQNGSGWKPRWAVLEGLELVLYKAVEYHPLARYMSESVTEDTKRHSKSKSSIDLTREATGGTISTYLQRRGTSKTIHVPLINCMKMVKQTEQWDLENVGQMTNLDMSFDKGAPFLSVTLSFTTAAAASRWSASINTLIDISKMRSLATGEEKTMSVADLGMVKGPSGANSAQEKARELGMYRSKFSLLNSKRGGARGMKGGKKASSGTESKPRSSDGSAKDDKTARAIARATFSADDPFADELFEELDSDPEKETSTRKSIEKRKSSIASKIMSRLSSRSSNGKSSETVTPPEPPAVQDAAEPDSEPHGKDLFDALDEIGDVEPVDGDSLDDRNKTFFARLKAEQEAAAQDAEKKRADLLASMTEEEIVAFKEAEEQQQKHEEMKGKMLKMHLKQYAKTGNGNSKILRKSKRRSRNVRRSMEVSVLKQQATE